VLLGQLANTTSTFEQVPSVNSNIIAAINDGRMSAYAASFSTVYLSSLAFGGTALILSWFVTDINKYLTSFVNKTVAGRSMRANQGQEEKSTGDV
jgi:CHASE2 domain-containing sensor protein